MADAVRELADGINGKALIDVTNALGPDFQLAIGFPTSGAEEVQKKGSGSQGFVAADDQNAKEEA